jgi:hypothetical protein
MELKMKKILTLFLLAPSLAFALTPLMKTGLSGCQLAPGGHVKTVEDKVKGISVFIVPSICKFKYFAPIYNKNQKAEVKTNLLCKPASYKASDLSSCLRDDISTAKADFEGQDDKTKKTGRDRQK